MSRRQHVVRSDDQVGIGASRSLSGCTILCSYEDCGTLYGGDAPNTVHLGSIAVSAGVDFQRCFVAATIGHINVDMPQGCF